MSTRQRGFGFARTTAPLPRWDCGPHAADLAGFGANQQVAIRLDRDLLETLRAGGAGRQTRVNDALREWVAKGKL